MNRESVIVMRKVNGCATVRFGWSDDLLDEEVVIGKGDVLPDVEDLHDLSYIEKRDIELYNAPILTKLAEIDLKSIRCLRDKDDEWIKKYKDEAAAERAKLRK